MRSTIATCLVCIVFCGLFPSGGAASPSGQARLLKVVALSHLGPHVPRIPHASVQNENLPRWSEKTWPRWPAPAGSLTPRGARLVTAMWEDLRAHFFNLGLLPEEHCPSPFRVFARADATLTAQDTACAILDGLSPLAACPVPYPPAGRIPCLIPYARGLTALTPHRWPGASCGRRAETWTPFGTATTPPSRASGRLSGRCPRATARASICRPTVPSPVFPAWSALPPTAAM